MKELNIVLVNPEIPQNTGNISRTCAVTGAALHIIRPTGFEISDRTLKRAGLDYWDKLDVTYYDSFEEFLKSNPDGEKYYFSSHAKRLYTDVTYTSPTYLIFERLRQRRVGSIGMRRAKSPTFSTVSRVSPTLSLPKMR